MSDGGRAVELMGPGKFDLVITDLVMPGLDGVEVLRTSKSLDMDTPVIVITAYPSVDTAERLIDLGAIDYIIKPFNLELIRITVAKVLKIRRTHGVGPQIAWREEAPGFDGLTGGVQRAGVP